MSGLKLDGAAYLKAWQIVALQNRGLGRGFCIESDGDESCFRPLNHEGRHAYISDSTGEVIAVFGEDVHAEARARGHAALESRLILASLEREDAFYRGHDRTQAATS